MNIGCSFIHTLFIYLSIKNIYYLHKKLTPGILSSKHKSFIIYKMKSLLLRSFKLLNADFYAVLSNK